MDARRRTSRRLDPTGQIEDRASAAPAGRAGSADHAIHRPAASEPSGAPPPHRESLLRVPLISLALSDPQIRCTPRAIDRRWTYVTGPTVFGAGVGFNPFAGRVFYGAASATADYLKAPRASARPHNKANRLVDELLFLVHDYLHAWAYALIRELAPKLDFGRARVTTANFEALVFAHILTEAVATVGLDYWYLATIDWDEVCPIGVSLHTPLTCAYHERHRAEYRRVWRGLVEVQHPDFLEWLTASYAMGGVRAELSERAMERSPLLAKWLRKEIEYSRNQRVNFRRWLRLLAGSPADPADDVDRPIAYGARWQKRLVAEVAERLWALVRHSRRERLAAMLGPDECWRTPRGGRVDFDLVNVNALDDRELELASYRLDRSQFQSLAKQFVSAHDLDSVLRDERASTLLRLVREHGTFQDLKVALKGARRLRASFDEPRDLLLLG
jgi:hypothetical protein